jgi:hypothetical protein
MNWWIAVLIVVGETVVIFLLSWFGANPGWIFGAAGLAVGVFLILFALTTFESPSGPSVPTTTAPATSGPPTTGAGSTAPPTAPPPTTTSPPVYTIDIDHDGKIDFVASGSQLVAVPKDKSDNGPVIVALIGGIFLVASTLVGAFVTAFATRSKKDGPADRSAGDGPA